MGTTAVVALVQGSSLHVANGEALHPESIPSHRAALSCSRLVTEACVTLCVCVMTAGDCRALLIQRGAMWRALSVDHKAGLDSEIKRVEAAGGRVSQVMGTYRVQGVLAVTRYGTST